MSGIPLVRDGALAREGAASSPDCPVCEAPGASFFMQVEVRSYWRCGHCRATFLDPAQLPVPAVERSEYLLHRNAVDDQGYRRFLARLAEPLLERLPSASSGLDFGCGPGPALAAMLREAGHRVALFDPLFFDDRAVLAQRYDFVTCSEVVEHFHRPADAFRQLDRLLRPGAWLAVMTCFQTDDARFAAWHYRRDPTHVVFYREETFRRLARIHGWQCEFPRANVALLRKPIPSAPPT